MDKYPHYGRPGKPSAPGWALAAGQYLAVAVGLASRPMTLTFLAGPDARWITGQNLQATGGLLF
jgi:hypothetical protein